MRGGGRQAEGGRWESERRDGKYRRERARDGECNRSERGVGERKRRRGRERQRKRRGEKEGDGEKERGREKRGPIHSEMERRRESSTHCRIQFDNDSMPVLINSHMIHAATTDLIKMS